jgi:hypothetical protein
MSHISPSRITHNVTLAHKQILEVGLQGKSLRRLKAEGNRKMKKLPLQYIYPASRARLIGRHQRTADEAQAQQDEVPTQQILQGAWELAAREKKEESAEPGVTNVIVIESTSECRIPTTKRASPFIRFPWRMNNSLPVAAAQSPILRQQPWRHPPPPHQHATDKLRSLCRAVVSLILQCKAIEKKVFKNAV